eukprot:14493608-Alexandrium_andersonii.AAC.1
MCSEFALLALPEVPGFSAWRGKVQRPICAASIFPGDAATWTEQIEIRGLAALSSSGYSCTSRLQDCRCARHHP